MPSMGTRLDAHASQRQIRLGHPLHARILRLLHQQQRGTGWVGLRRRNQRRAHYAKQRFWRLHVLRLRGAGGQNEQAGGKRLA